MSEIPEKKANEPKGEDFAWTKENDISLKRKYISFPLDNWKNIMSTKLGNLYEYNYQEVVNTLLVEDIFKNEKFFKEKTSGPNILIHNFININENPDEAVFSDLKPDFVIKNISSENLLKIIKKRSYMFRYDAAFNKLEKFKFINIIGEIKTNFTQFKSTNQIDNYNEFCKKMNKKYNSANIYYITMYIGNRSFKSFWNSELYINKRIITGYIPQIYNDICFSIKENLSSEIYEFDNKEKEKIRLANLEPKIINSTIYLKKTDNLKIYKNIEKNDIVNLKEKSFTDYYDLLTTENLILEDINKTIEIKQNKRNNLKNEIDRKKNEIDRKKNEINIMENKINNLDNEINEKENEKKKKEKEIALINSLYEDKKKEILGSKEETDNLENNKEIKNFQVISINSNENVNLLGKKRKIDEQSETDYITDNNKKN